MGWVTRPVVPRYWREMTTWLGCKSQVQFNLGLAARTQVFTSTSAVMTTWLEQAQLTTAGRLFMPLAGSLTEVGGHRGMIA
jgi:hypothetical protein